MYVFINAIKKIVAGELSSIVLSSHLLCVLWILIISFWIPSEHLWKVWKSFLQTLKKFHFNLNGDTRWEAEQPENIFWQKPAPLM